MMNKFWKRRVIFKIDNLEIKLSDIDIEFEINFNDKDEGNAGNIVFYNLSESTINQLTKDTQFMLEAGYEGFSGVILPGIIKVSKTTWDEVDKVTTLIVGDNTDAWLKSTINKTWKAGTRASQIIPEIINETGLAVGEIAIAKDVTYAKGKTFSTTCRKALKELATDTSSKLHCSNGRVYFRNPQDSSRAAVKLNSDTGLIASPELIDEGKSKKYSITALLNHKMRTDRLIRLESNTVNGNFRVSSGSHICKGEDFSTKCEVVDIG